MGITSRHELPFIGKFHLSVSAALLEFGGSGIGNVAEVHGLPFHFSAGHLDEIEQGINKARHHLTGFLKRIEILLRLRIHLAAITLAKKF
jgi:hypothetical protein